MRPNPASPSPWISFFPQFCPSCPSPTLPPLPSSSPWFCLLAPAYISAASSSSTPPHLATTTTSLDLAAGANLSIWFLLLPCRCREDFFLLLRTDVGGDRSAMGAEFEVAVAEVAAPPAKRRRRMVPAPAAAGGARRRRAPPPPPAKAVQRLFQACRAVFRGPGTVPAPAEVALLRAMLDRMRPEDVGLSADLRFFKAREAAEGKTPTITHTTIYKSENFSMVILFLPPNAVIPLHNHPGMTVFSKLLLGSMHIKSYDWAGPDPAASGTNSLPDERLRLAELVVDDVFTAPCDTSVLYPTAGGNMHRFRAIAPCAVLDILGPPYSIEEDRDCTYYAEIPYSHHSMTGSDLVADEQERRRLAWLKEIDMPKELKMCSVPYGGPPISDS